MAHGVKEDWEEGSTSPNVKQYSDKKGQVKTVKEGKGMGSRRIFSPQFKLQVLDSYRQDSDCRGNQRATARKYGIHRRQIQKWLQMESTLRCSAEASENGEVALNLAAARQRDDSSPCSAGSIPAPEQSPEEELVNVDKISDSEDDLSSNGSVYDQDQALDFTCAALSKRRFFPVNFKLEVIDAFYNDPTCRGNQRATARKYGIHRRQVQKWLNHESLLRGEAETECLDLSKKRKLDEEEQENHVSKRITIKIETQEQPSSVQETALCLVKQPSTPPEVTSSVDLYRPYSYSLCCHPSEKPTYDHSSWSPHYYPYYGIVDTSFVTKWLNQDAQYYRQTVNDVNHYTPLYS